MDLGGGSQAIIEYACAILTSGTAPINIVRFANSIPKNTVKFIQIIPINILLKPKVHQEHTTEIYNALMVSLQYSGLHCDWAFELLRLVYLE